MAEINTLKIALAGLLHDIGKFSERAGVEIPKEYRERNQAIYQPKYNWQYTHNHALHTAFFFDEFNKFISEEFTAHCSSDISLINLSAKHHLPNSPYQMIISEADCLSSGIERKEFEETDSHIRKSSEIPLFPILEDISISENWKENKPESFKFSYPLKEISPVNIFPQKKQNYSKKEYAECWQKFINLFKDLPHRNFHSLWLEHLDSLLFALTTPIPSATVGWTEEGWKEIIPDISLYDHARLTTAFATAMYLYHYETNTLNENSIKNRDDKKFLLIEGNFYGIQDFIFSEGGSTSKNAAKLLRGRSFYVSLLSELACDLILDKLALPFTSVVTNAAGKFKIIAQNTEQAHKTLKEAEEKINDWLINQFFGEVSIGICKVTAAYNDFVEPEKVAQLLKDIGRSSEERKYKKINLNKYGGSREKYLDSFSNGVCPLCNRRSAKKENKIKDEHYCDICYDQIKIGEALVKEDIIAVTKSDVKLHGILRIPIFNKYQISFGTEKPETLLHYWNINSLWKEENPYEKLSSFKLINGYVPRFTEEYDTEEIIDKLTYSESEDLQKETLEALKEGSILSFYHIGKLALKKTQSGFSGIDALGVFKADIDSLGTIFLKGLRKEKRTFSRYTAVSRQLNLFFTLYLPYLCRTEFKNIYTVFVGGDDLFVIGPWSEMISFAERISRKFYEYCCENSEITLSAGLFITKAETPVLTMAKKSEEALEKAKSEGKNRITIFGVSVLWSELEELEDIENKLASWLDKDLITNAFLYKLNEIMYMVDKEKEIKEKQIFNLAHLNPLTWRAKLYYFTIRNVGKEKPEEERVKLAEEFLRKLVEWFEKYRGVFRIPLWQVIYSRRKA